MENNITNILKKRVCKHCNKLLKSIGIQRVNSNVNYTDFATRAFHKSCFKKVREHSTVLKMIERIELKLQKHNELVT